MKKRPLRSALKHTAVLVCYVQWVAPLRCPSILAVAKLCNIIELAMIFRDFLTVPPSI